MPTIPEPAAFEGPYEEVALIQIWSFRLGVTWVIVLLVGKAFPCSNPPPLMNSHSCGTAMVMFDTQLRIKRVRMCLRTCYGTSPSEPWTTTRFVAKLHGKTLSKAQDVGPSIDEQSY